MLLVALLGVIVIYMFALVGFALYRDALDSRVEDEQSLYCFDLGQCTVSFLRYGLIGELFEVGIKA